MRGLIATLPQALQHALLLLSAHLAQRVTYSSQQPVHRHAPAVVPGRHIGDSLRTQTKPSWASATAASEPKLRSKNRGAI